MTSLAKLSDIAKLSIAEIKTVATLCGFHVHEFFEHNGANIQVPSAVAIGLYACLKQSGLEIPHCHLIIKYAYPYIWDYFEKPEHDRTNMAVLIADGTYCATSINFIPMNFKEAYVYPEEEAKLLPQPMVSTFYSIDRIYELLKDGTETPK